jgi:glycosyltransferase involved in cell wall biosynthesis
MLKERDGCLPRSFEDVRCDGIPGLVSIVLPVYNGMRYLAEAVDSVLAQDYDKWELIIVDDGSTDDSATIARSYADRDKRIRYVHQDNQTLPAALNTGHSLSRGEYITWTSDDNRLKKSFLSVLVQEMKERPSVDMLYANLEVIDEEGEITKDHDYYRDFQSSSRGTIQLPRHISMLHVWNCVGAAFLYRRRVITLLGSYSLYWCLCEDYDFFLRVNSQMILRHTHCKEAIYQYRVHRASLTSQSGNALIDKKMRQLQAYDDSRWDLLSAPLAWHMRHDNNENSIALYEELKRLIDQQGHYLVEDNTQAVFWASPTVDVFISGDPASSQPAEEKTQDRPARILIFTGEASECVPRLSDFWTLKVTHTNQCPPGNCAPEEGWLATTKAASLFHLIHAHGCARHDREAEKKLQSPDENALDISVIVCTNRPPEYCERALRSLANQSLPATDYEVLLVNNAPGQFPYGDIVSALARPDAPEIREIRALPGGLSHARNVGAAAARGRILLYMDDDAEADFHLVEKTVEAYENRQELGAAGGCIILQPPDPAPWWWGKELARFWSELMPDTGETQLVTDWLQFPYGANLSMRRSVLLQTGGFRSRYGPGGRVVQWSDDTLLCLQIFDAGHDIVLIPEAVVHHHVDPKRFSLRILFRMCRQSYGTMVLMMQEKRLAVKMNFFTALLRAMIRLALVCVPLPRSTAWRVEQLALSQGLVVAAYALFKGTFRPLLSPPPESQDK